MKSISCSNRFMMESIHKITHVIIGMILLGVLFTMYGCGTASRAAGLPFRAADSAIRGLDKMFRNPGPTIDRALQAGSKAASYNVAPESLTDNMGLDTNQNPRHSTPVAYPQNRCFREIAALPPVPMNDSVSYPS